MYCGPGPSAGPRCAGRASASAAAATASACTTSGSQRAVTTEPFLSPHFPRHAIHYTTAELLVRNLGGELRLESSWADGTSVVMLLPFCGDGGSIFRSGVRKLPLRGR